jgi:hypothetical protein
MPRNKVRVVPFQPNEAQSEVINLMKELYTYIAFNAPPIFVSIMKGQRDESMDSSYVDAAITHSTTVKGLVDRILRQNVPKQMA